MNHNKKGSSQLMCNVCQINLASDAEYALHEFSRKHCDNLLRISRSKPVISKQKAKAPEPPLPPEKEVPKPTPVTSYGSIAKYGYFVPGEIYRTGEEPKEYNTDYDPYLQKLAENPYKEREVPKVDINQQGVSLPTLNVTSFSRKKKKKIRTCQICNVTLSTVPEYEAHMRSPQHTWKLKMTGMGVSAHFVKASTDLHTTDVAEDALSNEQTETDNLIPSTTVTAITNHTAVAFPSLFCDVCDLLLNSEQQYNAHVSGKSHNDRIQKKAELKAKKEKLQSPAPNQLYCYSCKLALNNLFQYNEHKNGKKHKIKCRMLMREGITIPPEERVACWGTPRKDPGKPIVYPELYEKCVLEKNAEAPDGNTSQKTEIASTTVTANILSGMYHCQLCNIKFNTASKYEYHIKSKEHNVKLNENATLNMFSINKNEVTHPVNNESNNFTETIVKPVIVFHNRKTNVTNSASAIQDGVVQEMQVDDTNQISSEETVDNLKCNICNLDFCNHSQFELHLASEEHAKMILELKTKGKPDDEILKVIYSDKKAVKPDKFGRYCCNICSVTTNNTSEYNQHLSSTVHKYTEKDFKKKRMSEVKQVVIADPDGKYSCKLCKQSWGLLVEYNHHLHGVAHKSAQRADRAKKTAAKRRLLILQQRRLRQKYLISSLKRRDFRYWRKKCEKNPGIRTKISGIATDLHTGAMAAIPNLESLEPKIDPAKNVHLGMYPKPEENVSVKENKKKRQKPKSKMRKVKRKPPAKDQQSIPPLLPSPVSNPPPLLQRGAPNFPPFRQPPFRPNRSWGAYPEPYHPYRIEPYNRARPPFQPPPFQGPQRFQPGWPRYPSAFRSHLRVLLHRH